MIQIIIFCEYCIYTHLWGLVKRVADAHLPQSAFTRKEIAMFTSRTVDKKARLLLVLLVLAALALLLPAGAVFADNPPGTGQPSQSCQVSLVTPGNAANAPGSAFNPNGVAGAVYAGTQPQNSNNPNSVSQYDVACFQQASH